MRVLRGIGLVVSGAFAGFMTAAAFAKRAVPSRGGEHSDDVALVAIYDGVQLRSRASAFRGGSLLAWYGGIEVDLSEATLAPEVHLTVHALFGGVAIRLPAGCRVDSTVTALGGGVDVKKSTPENETGPKVTLDGLAAFGGIAVATRKAQVAADEA
jgi:hypothetical protein